MSQAVIHTYVKQAETMMCNDAAMDVQPAMI